MSISPANAESQSRTLARFAWVTLGVLIAIFGGLQVASFLRSGGMDFRIYYDAALALREGVDLFGAYSDEHPLTYIYPPFFAVLLMPLTTLSPEVAGALWTVVNVALLVGCLLLGTRELLRRFDSRENEATLPVVALLAVLLFLPRIKAELDQGQVDFLVLFGITLALVWLKRFPILAGCVLGIVANIKYQTVVFLPYFLVRRWWGAGFGFVAGAVGAALSGALVLGWNVNLDGLRRAFAGLGELIGIAPGDEPLPFIYPMEWSESLSLSSTFARWSNALGTGQSGAFALIAIAAIVCLVLGWWLYWRAGASLIIGRTGTAGRRDHAQEPLVALEWIGMLVAAMAFSPQTKMRHLALLLLLGLLVAMLLVVRKREVPRWPLVLAVIVMMLGFLLPPGAPEELRVMRKIWRAQGGPIWCVLLVYFVALWTAFKFVRQSDQSRNSSVQAPLR